MVHKLDGTASEGLAEVFAYKVSIGIQAYHVNDSGYFLDARASAPLKSPSIEVVS